MRRKEFVIIYLNKDGIKEEMNVRCGSLNKAIKYMKKVMMEDSVGKVWDIRKKKIYEVGNKKK